MGSEGMAPRLSLSEETEGEGPVESNETPREEPRLNLKDESGMTRRDLLRRGTVVGGTLLWVAPAIQSIGAKAYAQTRVSGLCTACISATINTVVTHATFNPTTTCCDCIDQGGGGIIALILCAVGGSCTVVEAGSGPCP
jgi:hypothetical protein